MIPDFPDISSLQPTFIWTCGEDIPDCCFRLPADSHAAVEMGEPKATQAKHAEISDPISTLTARRIVFPISVRTLILQHGGFFFAHQDSHFATKCILCPDPLLLCPNPIFLCPQSYPGAFFTPKRFQLFRHIPDVPGTPARPSPPTPPPTQPDPARPCRPASPPRAQAPPSPRLDTYLSIQKPQGLVRYLPQYSAVWLYIETHHGIIQKPG